MLSPFFSSYGTILEWLHGHSTRAEKSSMLKLLNEVAVHVGNSARVLKVAGYH